MSFSIQLGNFLYKNAFGIYRIMYSAFKKRQDAFEIELLKKHIHSGDTILDIGANIGFYGSVLSELAGEKGKVICFEPDPQNFSHLKKTCSHLKNTQLVNEAVGAESGTLTVYTSKELNVDHRTYEPESYDQKIEIQATSVDEFVGDGKVDFIKMDIQGFEISAIKGMKKTLERNPGIKILSEFWPYGLNKAGSSGPEYFRILKEAGFHVYLLEKNSLSPLNDDGVQALEKFRDKKENYYNIFASRSHV